MLIVIHRGQRGKEDGNVMPDHSKIYSEKRKEGREKY